MVHNILKNRHGFRPGRIDCQRWGALGSESPRPGNMTLSAGKSSGFCRRTSASRCTIHGCGSQDWMFGCLGLHPIFIYRRYFQTNKWMEVIWIQRLILRYDSDWYDISPQNMFISVESEQIPKITRHPSKTWASRSSKAALVPARPGATERCVFFRNAVMVKSQVIILRVTKHQQMSISQLPCSNSPKAGWYICLFHNRRVLGSTSKRSRKKQPLKMTCK